MNPRRFRTGLIVATAFSEIPVIRYGMCFFILPPLVSAVSIIWFVMFRPDALGNLLDRLFDRKDPQDTSQREC